MPPARFSVKSQSTSEKALPLTNSAPPELLAELPLKQQLETVTLAEDSTNTAPPLIPELPLKWQRLTKGFPPVIFNAPPLPAAVRMNPSMPVSAGAPVRTTRFEVFAPTRSAVASAM